MSFLKKRSFLCCAAMGTGCAVLLTMLLLAPFAWAIQAEVLPERAGWLCAAGCAGVSTLIPTVIIARTRRRQAMATGGAVAGCCLALAAVCCALGGKGYAFGGWLAALAAALLAGALAGAVLSTRKKSRKKRRH